MKSVLINNKNRCDPRDCFGCPGQDNCFDYGNHTDIDGPTYFKDLTVKAKEMLKQIRENKKNHKGGSQCRGIKCNGCHFWSGSIAALSELLGQPGVIN